MCPTVRSGEGAAAGFVAAAEATLREALGFRPFHGTLNLDGPDGVPPLSGFAPWESDEHCDGIRFAAVFVGGVRGAVIRPVVPDYPADRTELVAPVKLRDLFGLADGDSLILDEDAWSPDGPRTAVDRLDAFDAVVLDLDALTSGARDGGGEDATIREFAMALPGLDCPVGVCTDGSGVDALAALRRAGLDGEVDAVVGRDAVPAGAADGPVHRCLADLGVAPGNAVVVGGRPADARAAESAGTSFLHSNQLRVED